MDYDGFIQLDAGVKAILNDTRESVHNFVLIHAFNNDTSLDETSRWELLMSTVKTNRAFILKLSRITHPDKNGGKDINGLQGELGRMKMVLAEANAAAEADAKAKAAEADAKAKATTTHNAMMDNKVKSKSKTVKKAKGAKGAKGTTKVKSVKANANKKAEAGPTTPPIVTNPKVPITPPLQKKPVSAKESGFTQRLKMQMYLRKKFPKSTSASVAQENTMTRCRPTHKAFLEKRVFGKTLEESIYNYLTYSSELNRNRRRSSGALSPFDWMTYHLGEYRTQRNRNSPKRYTFV